MIETFLNDRVVLHGGDCLAVLPTLAENSVDAVVCDPPYHLSSIVKRFGADNAAPAKSDGATGVYARASSGFMGKKWDGGDVAFRPETWKHVLRVLKPGGHLLAFSGTRTYHRMACAIEDAGFEIRDMTAWLYGSGFPKSHDVSKAIDKHLGVSREKTRDDNPRNPKATGGGRDGAEGASRPWIEAAMARGYHEKDGPIPATAAAAAWDGFGTALKPALEPVCLGRKPLSEKTVAANVLKWGTGALNIDGCRIGYVSDQDAAAAAAAAAAAEQRSRQTAGRSYEGWGMEQQKLSAAEYLNGSAGQGRWPANLLHDGSAEVVDIFPETASTASVESPNFKNQVYGRGMGGIVNSGNQHTDSGSAARFFYTAKADSDDRLGSKHPTVKPIDLMQYLVRLVTPPGGIVLDPFSGTGTTGEAAWREGFRALLIEREEEYQADIRRRMSLCLSGPHERKRESIKQKMKDKPVDAGPLFNGTDTPPATVDGFTASLPTRAPTQTSAGDA